MNYTEVTVTLKFIIYLRRATYTHLLCETLINGTMYCSFKFYSVQVNLTFIFKEPY